MLDSCKMLQKQSEAFHTFLCHFFRSLKQNFIAYRSSKVSDCIFEIHQLWQSGFSRVYSNSCCSCWFEPGIIKIGQQYHKMYSNNILNFQESSTMLNALTKKVWKSYALRIRFLCLLAVHNFLMPMLTLFSVDWSCQYSYMVTPYRHKRNALRKS